MFILIQAVIYWILFIHIGIHNVWSTDTIVEMFDQLS